MTNTEIKHTLYRLIDIINFYDDISKLPDCNTCKRDPCEYIPLCGQTVRINCPLYKKEE